MKSEFNKTWKASRQVRKQRKYNYNAPLHIRQKFMAAPLSKDLKKKYGIKNIEVRKGDEVKVMRGKFNKKNGKVGMVDLQRTRISVDGIERVKKEGAKVAVWFHPSKVMIIDLNLNDIKRLKRIKKAEENKTVNKESTKTQDKKDVHKKK